MRAGKIESGTETVIASLLKKKIKLVIVANDLQENSREKIVRAAKKAKVKLVASFNTEELTHAIGKKRKVLGLTDQGFSNAFVKQINEGV